MAVNYETAKPENHSLFFPESTSPVGWYGLNVGRTAKEEKNATL